MGKGRDRVMSWWRAATDEPVVARGTLIIMGIAHLGISAGLRPPYVFADLIVAAPWLADVIFFVAGVLCFMVAANPRNRVLNAIALAVIVVAGGTRAIALATQTPWIPVLGGSTSIPPPPFFQWCLTILCELWIWPYLSGLVPLKQAHEAHWARCERLGRGGDG